LTYILSQFFQAFNSLNRKTKRLLDHDPWASLPGSVPKVFAKWPSFNPLPLVSMLRTPTARLVCSAASFFSAAFILVFLAQPRPLRQWLLADFLHPVAVPLAHLGSRVQNARPQGLGCIFRTFDRTSSKIPSSSPVARKHERPLL